MSNAAPSKATLKARPQDVEIDLGRTAFIVVDMQNAYATKGGMLDLGTGIDESRIRPVIEAHQRLLQAARTAGVKVIYLQFGYRPDLSDAGGPQSPNIRKQMAIRMIKERPADRDKLIVEGTWGWQIIDELKPQPADLVVKKSRYSGFAGTNLENVLNGLDIRYLVFTGVATNVCVESTAREAYFREFWPILVEDAMDHTGPDFVRQATLYNFESKMGWITRADAVMEALASRSGSRVT
jgi:ureidoacrylate peracid hydrolase